ncbi:MAG: hypothetical protein WC675_00070 [Patescibacteria group bacterium]|jgi:hypothetical protein
MNRNNRQLLNGNKPKGYIALVALLIIAAAALTIGIAVSLTGIEDLQISFGRTQAETAKNLANTCLEDGLERLRNSWGSYSGSLSVGENSCIIRTDIDGSTAILHATGTVGIYTQKIQIQVDNNLDVVTWQEE